MFSKTHKSFHLSKPKKAFVTTRKVLLLMNLLSSCQKGNTTVIAYPLISSHKGKGVLKPVTSLGHAVAYRLPEIWDETHWAELSIYLKFNAVKVLEAVNYNSNMINA